MNNNNNNNSSQLKNRFFNIFRFHHNSNLISLSRLEVIGGVSYYGASYVEVGSCRIASPLANQHIIVEHTPT